MIFPFLEEEIQWVLSHTFFTVLAGSGRIYNGHLKIMPADRTEKSSKNLPCGSGVLRLLVCVVEPASIALNKFHN